MTLHICDTPTCYNTDTAREVYTMSRKFKKKFKLKKEHICESCLKKLTPGDVEVVQINNGTVYLVGEK